MVPVTIPKELQATLSQADPPFLLDVREPSEAEICAIAGSTLIPLGELPDRLAELPKDRDIVIYCKVGGRSESATKFLNDRGFQAKNLAGGILAWIKEIDPSLKSY